jgi:nucleotide-binding universal stress UspA family protein
MTNPFRDQEKFMTACDQCVTGDDPQYEMYRNLITEEYKELQEAIAAGSHMLIMGAFGHSRLRSFILGSATADILKNVQIPTLVSH